ncbi:hypothetical protein LOK49_LG01G01794 [Camellia lanceoleosa]|uniref:Uncharacterized protein n=1 Tax=Camellia lanceoleosa TaxID=1840588 RepID=A0ACC0J6Q2_9ERIC|nr:hypothetical protein LOK49_LG01G01794 [Camellia lanceoleosa]
MDPTLLETAKNDDDSDLEAEFSGDVLDVQINIMEIPMEKHEVNSSPTNEKEVLALELDLHPPNNTKVDDNDDGDDDGDTADRPLIPNSTTDQGVDVSKAALMIGFFTLISGSTISALSNLKDARRIETKLTLEFKDIFLHPDKLPDAFYDILLLTIAFTVSIVLAVVSLWPIIKDQSFFYRTLLFAGVAAFFISFGYILKDKVPKFWLSAAESFSIPSFWLLWVYGFSLVLLTVTISCAAHLLLSAFRHVG